MLTSVAVGEYVSVKFALYFRLYAHATIRLLYLFRDPSALYFLRKMARHLTMGPLVKAGSQTLFSSNKRSSFAWASFHCRP